MNLTSLEDREIRGDLIEMYKIVNGIEKINWTNGLPLGRYKRRKELGEMI